MVAQVLGCLRGYAFISFHELPPGEQNKDMLNIKLDTTPSEKEIQAQQRITIYQPNHKTSVDIRAW